MNGLIDGHDPAGLATALRDLELSDGWKFICDVINRYTEDKRHRIFQTIEGEDEAQKLANHNRNVVAVKTLESVPDLVRVAREKCDADLQRHKGA